MTRQEEIESKGYYYSENLIPESEHRRNKIREGIADILEVWMDRDLALATAHTIMAKEKYQGVAIKVDGDYIGCDGIGSMGVMSRDCPLLKAGYVAVEPLIEE